MGNMNFELIVYAKIDNEQFKVDRYSARERKNFPLTSQHSDHELDRPFSRFVKLMEKIIMDYRKTPLLVPPTKLTFFF